MAKKVNTTESLGGGSPNPEIAYQVEKLERDIGQMAKRSVRIPEDRINDNASVPVSINGRLLLVPRGVTVALPYAYADVLEQAGYI